MSTNRFVKLVLWAAAVFVTGAILSMSALAAEVPDALLTLANSRVKEVIAVQETVTEELMATEGILGTAVGQDHQGNLALMVYVNSEHKNMAELVAGMPQSMGGVPVAVQVTEPFRPLLKFKPMDGGAGHRLKQEPPIKLGTSGGWRHDLANGFCCGGTLGSLVQKNGKQYILSNYHVLEGDIVDGGNARFAEAGDPVIQPGLIDASCNANNAQNVATLSGIKSLPTTSNVDAAIAEVIPGMVRTNGEIIDIGTISATTVAASLDQKVKKSGRTTGLTQSVVNGLNVTVSVTYDDECAGNTAFTKIFTGQIFVKNRIKRGSFISGGDSGSLMVEDMSNPRAVGLLFAGSATIAVANPIDQVLKFFGASMVGRQ